MRKRSTPADFEGDDIDNDSPKHFELLRQHRENIQKYS